MTLPDYQWLREQIESEAGRNRIRKAGQLLPLADELGIRPAQLAIAWCLKNPHVSTVILGASRVEQLRQNLEALDKVALLTDEVMRRIEDVLQNRPELPTQF
jgi:aryl-alcohol dehydrogenase-like predicted oxidoreductase